MILELLFVTYIRRILVIVTWLLQIERQIRTIFWSKIDSNYLNLKLKVFKKDDNKELPLVQNLRMGEEYFNPFLRLRNQLVIAIRNFVREENLYSVLITRLSKDMDEQLKLAHKVVDVVDQANRKICVAVQRGQAWEF